MIFFYCNWEPKIPGILKIAGESDAKCPCLLSLVSMFVFTSRSLYRDSN